MVRQSVTRSLERLRTSYLDVVFCHDVEHVTDGDVIGAVGELFEFVRQGKVRYIGISSYRIDLLAQLAQAVREQCGKPVDVIQNWGQLTLQNSKLESEGLKLFKDAGVSCVCNSSPLAIGLLRQGGVPVGRLGDFHPAPEGLRKVSQDIADYVASQGESLAALALRFSLWRAQMTSHESFRMCTITGISTIPELTENIKTAGKILTSESGNAGDLVNSLLDEEQVKKDQALFDRAHDMFGDWIDYGFTVPEKGWSRELKRVVS